jgi:hypothetical protein
MRGFRNFDAAHRFCRAFDEVRNFLRSASYINQNVSLAACRTGIFGRALECSSAAGRY